MGIKVEINIKTSGPLFDGRFKPIVDAYRQEVEERVAFQALADVHYFLDQQIKVPTPYYETQVTAQRVKDDMVVHDRDIVYGPWLEGVGERNQTTRFKGYASFRKATETVKTKVESIAQHVIREYIRRLNGM